MTPPNLPPEQAPKHSPKLPLLVIVLGPTASGKTALSLDLARRFDGEIVNCDSVAMYRDFEIGTAKPTRTERAEVPHHLVDFVDPRSDVSAGEYARQARLTVAEIAGRAHLPIVSGGTGLYLRAMLEGLFAGRSARKGCATVCGAEQVYAAAIICTVYLAVSTPRQPSASTPTTFQR